MAISQSSKPFKKIHLQKNFEDLGAYEKELF